MIFDQIKNSYRYFKKSIFKEIFEKLKEIDINTPNGNYSSNELYSFIVMSYETQISPDIIESHKNKIDIHVLLTGKETIRIYKEKGVSILEEYNSNSDCKLYKELSSKYDEINLEPNYMAVFFPNEIHAPAYAYNKDIINIKKVVIKIDKVLLLD